MRLTFLLPVLVAPFALAAPDPKPNPVAAPEPASTGGLLSTLSDVEGLLSEENVDNLKTIITGAAKLLSPKNIDVLQDILTNAHTLLTKDFVDNTTTLIGDATPVRIHFRQCKSHANRHSWWRTCRNCWVVFWARYRFLSR